MYIEKIKLKDDYRNLKKGLTIILKPLTLLVGEQGCGKSSILSLLQKNENLDVVLNKELQKGTIKTFYFDSEKMNPRIQSIDAFTTPSGQDSGIGLANGLLSRFKSHGEILREFTVNRIKRASNCVLFLDEPESALSLKDQFILAEEFKKAITENVQIIAATHCLPLIESVDEVFDMVSKKWIKSADFIKKSRDI